MDHEGHQVEKIALLCPSDTIYVQYLGAAWTLGNIKNLSISFLAQATKTNYHRLEGLKQQTCLSYSSGARILRSRFQTIQFLVRTLFLVYRWLPPHRVFTEYMQAGGGMGGEGNLSDFSFYKDTDPTGSSPSMC